MEAQFEALSELVKSGQKLSFGQDFFVKFYQAFLYSDRWQQYIKGVGTTLLVTAIALVLGVVLGAIVAMIRVGHAQQKPHHHNPVLGVFNASPTMLAMGILALRIIAIHFPMAGFNVISSSAFQALGRGTVALLVSVIRQLVVLVPAAWLLSHTGNVNAVWVAFPIAELVAVTLCAVFMRKCHHDILLPMEAGQKTAASV